MCNETSKESLSSILLMLEFLPLENSKKKKRKKKVKKKERKKKQNYASKNDPKERSKVCARREEKEMAAKNYKRKLLFEVLNLCRLLRKHFQNLPVQQFLVWKLIQMNKATDIYLGIACSFTLSDNYLIVVEESSHTC